jgi:hypothetical protein
MVHRTLFISRKERFAVMRDAGLQGPGAEQLALRPKVTAKTPLCSLTYSATGPSVRIPEYSENRLFKPRARMI